MVIHSKSHLLNNKGMWSEVEELELCWTERLSSILPGVKLSMGRTQLSMRLAFMASTLCGLSDRVAWVAVEICLPHNCCQDWMRLCVKAHCIDRLAMIVREWTDGRRAGNGMTSQSNCHFWTFYKALMALLMRFFFLHFILIQIFESPRTGGMNWSVLN